MRISCPNCSTEYDVPDVALAGRSRVMRCARCGHQWRNALPGIPRDAAADRLDDAVPDATPEAPATAPEPVPEPAPEPPAPAPPPASLSAPREVLTWPEALAIPDSPVEAPARTFGLAADTEARAALAAAASSEGGPPLLVPVADANTAAGQALPPHELEGVASQDRFAELFRSAQDRAATYDVEEPPPAAVKISSRSLVVVLVTLLVLAFIFLEREHVMQAFPASAKLFHSLGFN